MNLDIAHINALINHLEPAQAERILMAALAKPQTNVLEIIHEQLRHSSPPPEPTPIIPPVKPAESFRVYIPKPGDRVRLEQPPEEAGFHPVGLKVGGIAVVTKLTSTCKSKPELTGEYRTYWGIEISYTMDSATMAASPAVLSEAANCITILPIECCSILLS